MSEVNDLAKALAAEHAMVNRRYHVERAIEVLQQTMPEMNPRERKDIWDVLQTGYCAICGNVIAECTCFGRGEPV